MGFRMQSFRRKNGRRGSGNFPVGQAADPIHGIEVGHLILSIGSLDVQNLPFKKILSALQKAPRPVTVKFCNPYPRTEMDIMQDTILTDLMEIMANIMELDTEAHHVMEFGTPLERKNWQNHTYHNLDISDSSIILELIFSRIMGTPPPDLRMVTYLCSDSNVCTSGYFADVADLSLRLYPYVHPSRRRPSWRCPHRCLLS